MGKYMSQITKLKNILKEQSITKSDQEKKDVEDIPYAEAIGSVMYTMISTRPDIAYVVSLLNRFMSNSGREHWKGFKRLLRYLKATSQIGHKTQHTKHRTKIELEGYVNADYASNRDTRKSITSYCFQQKNSCTS
ncbi:hypothetical protein CsatA_004128 [Cannabis sativa]